MHLKEKLASLILKSLQALAQELALDAETTAPPIVKLEVIRKEEFGDYACTSAMDPRLRAIYAKAKPELHNPRSFAQAISSFARKEPEAAELVAKVQVAGPGFINFFVQEKAMCSYLFQLRKEKDALFLVPQEKRKDIIFEFVSANPTGPLNIVSARAAALGDVCCRLLETVGHKLVREYYVNDCGNQISLLGQSGFLRYLEVKGCPVKFALHAAKSELTPSYPPGKALAFPHQAYHGLYIKDIVQKMIQEQAWEASPDELAYYQKLAQEHEGNMDYVREEKFQEGSRIMGQALLEYLLQEQKQDLLDFRVHFHNFFRESSLYDSHNFAALKKQLSADLYTKEGCLYFQSTKYGDDKDRVVVRADGRPTYFLADIAYHADKIKRGFHHIYNIWGPDHHGYIARMQGAMQSLGYKGKFEVLIAQQVHLLEKGKKLAMSKRTGHLLSLRALLEEIPVDVARYFFAMRSFAAPMDFDLAEAKDHSERNPYYYVAYSHARICSIFRKLYETRQIKALAHHEMEQALAAFVWTASRRRLLFQLCRFSEEIQEAAESLEPHRISSYLYQLAATFTQFYSAKENRIIEQEAKSAACLLVFLELTAFCLKKGLSLLGAEAPESMARKSSEAPADTTN